MTCYSCILTVYHFYCIFIVRIIKLRLTQLSWCVLCLRIFVDLESGSVVLWHLVGMALLLAFIFTLAPFGYGYDYNHDNRNIKVIQTWKMITVSLLSYRIANFSCLKKVKLCFNKPRFRHSFLSIIHLGCAMVSLSKLLRYPWWSVNLLIWI